MKPCRLTIISRGLPPASTTMSTARPITLPLRRATSLSSSAWIWVRSIGRVATSGAGGGGGGVGVSGRCTGFGRVTSRCGFFGASGSSGCVGAGTGGIVSGSPAVSSTGSTSASLIGAGGFWVGSSPQPDSSAATARIRKTVEDGNDLRDAGNGSPPLIDTHSMGRGRPEGTRLAMDGGCGRRTTRGESLTCLAFRTDFDGLLEANCREKVGIGAVRFVESVLPVALGAERREERGARRRLRRRRPGPPSRRTGAGAARCREEPERQASGYHASVNSLTLTSVSSGRATSQPRTSSRSASVVVPRGAPEIT